MVAIAPLVPVAGRALALAAGSSLVRAATRSLVNGAAFQAGAELVSEIANWIRSIDGDWDSQGELPEIPVPPGEGCWSFTSGSGAWQEKEGTNPYQSPIGEPLQGCISCTVAFIRVDEVTGQSIFHLTRTYDATSGFPGPFPYVKEDTIGRSASWAWRINPGPDAVCTNDPYPDTPSDPPVNLPPISDGTCNFNVTFDGFLINPDGTGNLQPVFSWSPATTSLVQSNAARAAGGVIVGGCNFAPVVSVGGGGDGNEPPIIIPRPDGGPGDDPWWEDIIKGIATGVAASVTQRLLDELFNRPMGPYTYTMRAACNYKEDGSFETYSINFPEQGFSDRILSLSVGGYDLLQQHLLWRTPTCSGSGPSIQGDPVTINFESAEYSPFGNDRLRKRFVYFDQSGATLEQTTDHWKDFVWQAGSVIVSAKGTALGKPQVWAATVDEAKRVINHAAAITGADMSNVEWLVGAPKDPRYGGTGEMHVMRGKNGAFGITKRGKPSGSPPALAPSPTLGSG